MGKGSGGGGTNTVETVSGPPQQVLNAYTNLTNQASNVAAQPLQQYAGSTVAGFTPDQTSAFNTVDQAQGVSAPYTNAAAQLTAAGSAPITPTQFSPGQVSQYESPYTQQVVNATQAEFNNQNQQQNQSLVGNAVSQGAWGGDRSAIAQAELANQQQLAQAPTIAGLENQGYSQALGEFNTQQQAGVGAQEASGYLAENAGFGLGSLGSQAQNNALTGASAQLQSGALQQQLDQEQLNVPYQNFLAQQSYPFQTTGWEAGIAEGLGSGSGGTGTTTSPAASSLGQDVGLGLSGLGVAGQLGAFSGSAPTGALVNPSLYAGLTDAVGTGFSSAAAGDAILGAAAKQGGRIMPRQHRDMGGATIPGQGAMAPVQPTTQISGLALPKVPDFSASVVPGAPSSPGHSGMGIPQAPHAYRDPASDMPSASALQGSLQAGENAGKEIGNIENYLSARGGRIHRDGGGGVAGMMPPTPVFNAVNPGNSQMAGFAPPRVQRPNGRPPLAAGGTPMLPATSPAIAGYTSAPGRPDIQIPILQAPNTVGAGTTSGMSAPSNLPSNLTSNFTAPPTSSLPSTSIPNSFAIPLQGTPAAAASSASPGAPAMTSVWEGNALVQVPVDAGNANAPATGSAHGGRVGFDDGGAIQAGLLSAGASPQATGASPFAQNQYSQFANLPPEKLRELAVRIPPNTPQGQLVQRALAVQQRNPGAANQIGQQSQGPVPGLAPQAPVAPQPGQAMNAIPGLMWAGGRAGFDDGGYVTDPDSPSMHIDLGGSGPERSTITDPAAYAPPRAPGTYDPRIGGVPFAETYDQDKAAMDSGWQRAVGPGGWASRPLWNDVKSAVSGLRRNDAALPPDAPIAGSAASPSSAISSPQTTVTDPGAFVPPPPAEPQSGMANTAAWKNIAPAPVASSDGPSNGANARPRPARASGMAPNPAETTDTNVADFIPPQTSGMTIPTVSLAGDKPTGITPDTGEPQGAHSPAHDRSAFNMNSPWMALVAAGAGMAASRSPQFGNAVGEGLQSGIKYEQGQQAANREQQQVDQTGDYQQGELKARAQSYDLEGKKLDQAIAAAAAQHAIETLNANTNAQRAADEANYHKDELGVRQQMIEQGRYTWMPGSQKDENGNDVQGAWRMPTRGDEQPQFVAGVTTTGKGANPAARFQMMQGAYLALHPGDSQGALDYAGGRKIMSPDEKWRAAQIMAQKDIASGNASDDIGTLTDKYYRGFPSSAGPAPAAGAAAPAAQPAAKAAAPAAATTPSTGALPPIPTSLAPLHAQGVLSWSPSRGRYYDTSNNQAYMPDGSPVP